MVCGFATADIIFSHGITIIRSDLKCFTCKFKYKLKEKIVWKKDET